MQFTDGNRIDLHLFPITKLDELEKDKVITREIVDSYLTSLKKYDPTLRCVDVQYLSGVSHSKGWPEVWKKSSKKNIQCKE